MLGLETFALLLIRSSSLQSRLPSKTMNEQDAAAGSTKVDIEIFPAFAPNIFGLERSRLRSRLPALEARKQAAHKVRANETLATISEHLLPPEACQSQVYMFERAIRELNGVPSDQDVSAGQMLKLPGISDKGDFETTNKGGHTIWSPFDGSVVTTVSEGTVITNYIDDTTIMLTPDGSRYVTKPDGSSTVFQADGTVINRDGTEETVTTSSGIIQHYDLLGNFVKVSVFLSNGCQMDRSPDGEGGVIDRHCGVRKENNFTLFEKQNGSIEVQNEEEETVQRFVDGASLEDARNSLMQSACATITDTALLSKFKADMVRFENRVINRGLTAEEIENTYKALGWLLDTGEGGKIPFAERVKLAQQVLSQCNTPSSIDQGHHHTVCVSAVETRVYTRRPARAAQLVCALALAGRHVLPNGAAVRLTETSLRPDFEGVTNPPIDGKRSFASQLFQVAAVNSVYTARQERVIYDQTTPNLSAQAVDTGERLYTVAPAALLPKGTTPGLSNHETVEAYELLTGDREIDVILEHTANSADPDMVYCVGKFSNMDEFARKLALCKRKGRLPVLLALHTGNQPFFEDSGNGTAGGSGGWSVVTVTDYNEKEQLVEIDNQWGSQSDHMNAPLTLKEVYYSTMDPCNRAGEPAVVTASAKSLPGKAADPTTRSTIAIV